LGGGGIDPATHDRRKKPSPALGFNAFGLLIKARVSILQGSDDQLTNGLPINTLLQ
jgi:hypothetical protein